jgi:subtilisin
MRTRTLTLLGHLAIAGESIRTGRAVRRAQLAIAGAAAIILLGGCTDKHPLVAPEDEASFSRGGSNTVDVIVVLKKEFAPGSRAANRSRAAEIAEDVGIQARFTYGSVLFGFAGSVPEGRMNALRRHPLVDYVELDATASIPPTVEHHRPGHGRGNTDPAPVAQVTPWGIHRIGPAGNGATGSGVSVYILDTGIAPRHPDLEANLGQGYAPFPCEGSCTNPWDDDHGHGTHVAGTVGAVDNDVGVVGVAPQVTLHSVKVLGSTGSGPWSGIIAGIDWVAAQETDKPRVINMSLGGGGPEKSGDCTLDGYQGFANAIHESLCNAKNAGVVIVAAAGNNGGDASFIIPAAYYDAVITVSAVRCDWESDERCKEGTEGWTTWSNWGVGSDGAWSSRHSLPVLIGAPGANIRSTARDGGYGSNSGTSMAAPHVAGAAALLVEGGNYTKDGSAFARIRQALLDNAECTASWDDASGNPHFESFLNLQSGSGECAPPEPPPAPAAPTGLEATAISHHEIQLSWNYEQPVPEDVQFQLSRWDGSNWANSILLGAEPTFTHSRLPSETTYNVPRAGCSEWREVGMVERGDGYDPGSSVRSRRPHERRSGCALQLRDPAQLGV